jgi:hypothetical protein
LIASCIFECGIFLLIYISGKLLYNTCREHYLGYAMLLAYWKMCCGGYVLLSIILWGFARHAHRVNAKRAAGDPERKEFHPAAVHFAPFIWFPLLIVYVFVFVIRGLLYGIFLVIFTVALVVIRKPFILIWLDRIARKVGNKLLEADTLLANLLFPQWKTQAEPS